MKKKITSHTEKETSLKKAQICNNIQILIRTPKHVWQKAKKFFVRWTWAFRLIPGLRQFLEAEFWDGEEQRTNLVAFAQSFIWFI